MHAVTCAWNLCFALYGPATTNFRQSVSYEMMAKLVWQKRHYHGNCGGDPFSGLSSDPATPIVSRDFFSDIHPFTVAFVIDAFSPSPLTTYANSKCQHQEVRCSFETYLRAIRWSLLIFDTRLRKQYLINLKSTFDVHFLWSSLRNIFK